MNEAVRNTARVILLNAKNKVLLVNYTNAEPLNPWRPDLLSYWVPPGGEVEENESFEAAVVRELREELEIFDISICGCLATRKLKLKIDGVLRPLFEKYFLANYDGDFSMTAFAEQEGIVDTRWWQTAELRAAQEHILPQGLVELVSSVLKNGLPDHPIELT